MRARRSGAIVRPMIRFVAGGLSLLFAFTALYVTAFHAPRPHGVDVGVVAGAAQAGRLQAKLDATAPGAFDVERYATEAGAQDALLGTRVQAALVPGPRARVLVAEALGVAPTEAVTAALQRARRARPPKTCGRCRRMTAAGSRRCSP